jgi:PAS domain S-box-containing protein
MSSDNSLNMQPKVAAKPEIQEKAQMGIACQKSVFMASLTGRYGVMVCAVAASALLRWLMPDVLSRAPYLGFYPAVVIAAILGGVGPGLVATFGSLLLVNFIFVQFNFLDYGLQMRNVIWVLGGIGVSFLAGKLRRAHERLQQSNLQLERRMAERKQAEAALRESEERFRVTQELSPDGFIVFHPERDAEGQVTDFTWVYENAAVARMNGTDPEKIAGKRLLETFPANEGTRFIEAYRQVAKTGTPAILEDSYQAETINSRTWFRTAVVRAGEDIAVHVQDITERKLAEEALRHSEARWNAAIESFEVGAIIATEDEQVIYWNPAARAMHGFIRQDEGIEPLEKTPVIFQLWTPDGSHMLELDEWPMRRIKRGELVRNLELRIRRPDQCWEKVFSYSGSMVETASGERLIFLTCQDLTELRKTERALRESDQRFRLALRNAPVSVAAQDRNLRYIWAYNQKTARQDEIIGKLDSDIFMPEEAARITNIKQRVLNEGVEFREQIWLDRPGGRIFLDLCWEPLRDEKGEIAGVVSATVNLTQIKQAEEALKASLGEKEVLLKEIHHRVKNNMQVISSLMALQADQLQDAATKAVLQDVTHRVRSMALVHEKLYQSADMAKVDFADYAQSLLGYLWRAHSTATANIQLTLDLEHVLLSVNAAVPFGLILNELATNALKHAFKKTNTGEVIVSLRGSHAGVVHLRVRDNGTGLPPGFDWRQTKSLGLHLVRILARQLSASVDVSSTDGAEFSIRFGGPNQ